MKISNSILCPALCVLREERTRANLLKTTYEIFFFCRVYRLYLCFPPFKFPNTKYYAIEILCYIEITKISIVSRRQVAKCVPSAKLLPSSWELRRVKKPHTFVGRRQGRTFLSFLRHDFLLYTCIHNLEYVLSDEYISIVIIKQVHNKN